MARPAHTTEDEHEHEGAIEGWFRWLSPHIERTDSARLQVWGYAGSVVLTFLAYGLVMNRLMPPALLLAVVLTLALGQAALQLGVFMHLRESRGPAWQVIPLLLAFFIAFGMIGMSVWIMAFKSGVS
jgi:cytochrome aa3 quinol oxidase subunit IV